MFVEDFVYIVKDECLVGIGIVKEEYIGGIGSNFVGGVWMRVVMCRELDGRVV